MLCLKVLINYWRESLGGMTIRKATNQKTEEISFLKLKEDGCYQIQLKVFSEMSSVICTGNRFSKRVKNNGIGQVNLYKTGDPVSLEYRLFYTVISFLFILINYD